MDNNLLIFGAVALGLYMMSGSKGERKFNVPGVGLVPKSQLPSLGYVNVAGNWYSQAQVDAAAAQAGVSSGTVQPGTNAWTTIANILSAVGPLVTTIGNYTSGGSGGGGMAGVNGINYTCADAGYWLKVGNDPRAGKDLANCRWKR